jgi:predicted Zn-dependent protease
MKKILAILVCTCFAAALGAQNPGQGGASSSGRRPSSSSDIMGAFSEMDRLFETSDEDLTLEDDYYLGRAVAAQILHTYRLYNGNLGLVFYLNEICQALVINSSSASVAYNGYHVGVLDSREINAFATPGGHIFLTRGLVECADSEDSLAAVIAHELAHIQLRHAAAIINDQRLAGELSQSADRASSIASRNAGSREEAVIFDRNISVMVNTLFKNGFSQEQEFEADTAAVALLRGAGYDPSALVTMLRVLERVQPLHPGGFNSTHPSPAARLANLERVPMTGNGRATRTYRNSRFAPFRSN